MAYDDIDDESTPDDPLTSTVALARPDVPVSLIELAALKGEALEVIEARIAILSRVRKAALQATTPSDWVLFRTRDGQVTGYLQDAGCERVRDLFGIRIFNISKPEKIPTADPNLYHYIVTGDGACALTRQVIERIEGGRSSDEDFCRDKSGIEKEKAVRKATRANLDGAIVRELAGLSNVAIEEIAAAWEGTTKKTDRCPRGRGFGSGAERAADVPDISPPICPKCEIIGLYRQPKGKKPFWGCKNYESHPEVRFVVDAEAWQKSLAWTDADGKALTPAARLERIEAERNRRPAEAPAAAQASTTPPAGKVTPDPVDQVFKS